MTGSGVQGAKRFYKRVDVGPHGAGHTVLLDDRPIKSPGKSPLALPTEALAKAVAEEWDAQAETIDASSMPMMSFSATTIDRVSPQRALVVDELAGFGNSDLLCYRADLPDTLVTLQTAEWQPLVEWAGRDLGADLKITTGLMPIDQDPATLAALRTHVEAVPDWELVALHTFTTVSGSLVIGIAAIKGHLDPERAFDIGQLDETHQAERWGLDREAELRRRRLKDEMMEAGRFLSLVRAAG
jgi:chaperone required for assembly of F1-ATPase